MAVEGTDGHEPLRHLYLTGHSLGAAMAVVAAAIIHGDDSYAEWRGLVRGIYTYGQPMVGNAEFARTCDERFGRMLFRHVYGHDLVPRLPPMTTGVFKHFGSEFSGAGDGWSPRSKLSTQAITALLSIPIGAAAFVFQQLPVLRGLRLPYSLFDHSPTSYLEAFRAARS
jgi:Lipase (class 3)